MAYYYKSSFKAIFQKIVIFINILVPILAVASFIIFLPKYTAKQAHNVLLSDNNLIAENIKPLPIFCITPKHGNPFGGYGYVFDYTAANGEKYRIYFDNITGEYNVIKRQPVAVQP